MPSTHKPRLLLIAYYFPPLGGPGSQRALSLAQHLPAHEWDVVVVAPKEGVFGTDESLPADALPGIRVVRTGSWEPAVLLRKVQAGGSAGTGGSYVEEADVGSLGSAVRKWVRRRLHFPDSCRGWIRHAVAAAEREQRLSPFSVVLSSSPPVSAHVAARRFAEKHGLPWIADWRDLWTDRLPVNAGRMEEARLLESELLASASGISAPMDALRDFLLRKRGSGPVVTIRNGFEPGHFKSESVAPPPREGLKMVYTGTIYSPEEQHLGSLFEAIRQWEGVFPGVPFQLRIFGKVHPQALETAGPGGCAQWVRLEGFQPHRTCLEAMEAANLLLLLATDKKDKALNVEVPAKTYEYLAARRPILALADPAGETGRILGGRQGVWVRHFRDTEGIRRALEEATAIESPTLLAWPDIEQYSRQTQAAKMSDLLAKVLAEEPRS